MSIMTAPAPIEETSGSGGLPRVRRYPEIYANVERRERKGRETVRAAPVVGATVGAMLGLTLALLSIDHGFGASGVPGAIALGTLVGLLTYSRMRRNGLARIFEAQRTLILIDTEENTRRTAEALERRS